MSAAATLPRYRSLSSYLKGLYPERVQKVTLDAGLTCPNRDGRVGRGGCIYCNARGSGTGAWAAGKSIPQQLQEGMERLQRRYGAGKFIAYFQSFSNTYAPPEQLQVLFQGALDSPQVVGLSVGTRPDCLDEATLEILASYTRTHLVWLELGLQSAHDQTLARLNRGHDAVCFRRAVMQAAGRGLHLVAHVILGLPGEGRQEMLATADFLGDLPLDGVKLHLLYVIRDTPLAVMYAAGRYQPLERNAYIELVGDFLERLPPGMVIHRLTGDPHPEELVAPTWCLDKAGVRRDIHQSLETRPTHQGRLWRPRPQTGDTHE